MKRQGIGKDLKHYALLLPFFTLFTAFYLWPLIYGFLISFTKWNGVQVPAYIGMDNYVKILGDKKFLIAFSNLAKFIAVVVPVGIGLALLFAILVSGQKKAWAGLFRSVFFFPIIIPLFLSASIWRFLLSPEPVGILNNFMHLFNAKEILWLKDPKYMVFAACIVDIWRAVGFHFILLYAGIKGIPAEQTEAAEVDGANSIQRAFFITIPQLEPVLFLVVVNAFIGGLQAFDLPWLMSVSQWGNVGNPEFGMLFPVMDIIDRAWGMRLAFGEASAYSIIILIITLIITGIQFVWRRVRLEA
jgi:multiple sugar transport system permease protein